MVLQLPHPVRVLDSTGAVLWQNQAAESSPEDLPWSSQPITWQGKKALLASAETEQAAPSPLIAELEAENERLRRHQKQTARRKKKAEDSARQTEKAADDFEKRERKLREQLQAAEQKVVELESQVSSVGQELEDAEPLATPKGKKSKAKAKSKSKAKASSKSKEESSPQALLDQIQELTKQNSELLELLDSVDDQTERNAEKAAWEAEKAASESALTELQSQLKSLEETHRSENRALRAQLDAARVEFDGKSNPLAAQLEAAAARYVELQVEFDAFRQEVEEEELQRQLEEQLADKVRELEDLERSFEDEQKAFDQQKQELESRLTEQEKEFHRLRDSVSGSSQENQPPAPSTELIDSLQETQLALAEASKREQRLNEKLESANQLKEEQVKLLALVKEEMLELRLREKERRDALRQELERTRSESKQHYEEVVGLREATEKLENKLIESRRELSEARLGAPSGGLTLRRPGGGDASPAADGASSTVKTQLEFAQSRLRETERQLDETRSALKKSQADAYSAKETEKLAFQDTLTGLPNRHIVHRFLDFSHKQSKTTGKNYALFLIDVDGFRVLNDTFGRDWGDALLKAVGERLSGMRGKNHVVARHSQDRFLLLVGDLAPNTVSTFLADAARALLDALAHPFEVKAESIKLTGSLGISVGPGRGDDFKELLPHAELALENAKGLGPGSYVIYNDALAQKSQRDLMYLRQMEHAIARHEFQNVYQPVFNLNKGLVMGFELLLRWHHRDQRVLKPEEFLDVALSSGLIFSIAQVTWPVAFKALARWRKQRPGVTLSINLSDRELLNPKLVERAVEWAKAAGVEPSAILFEVRDASRLRSSSSWWTILSTIQRAGFGLVLDDYAAKSSLFGTLSFSGFIQAKSTVDERNPICTPAPSAHKGVQYVAKRIQSKFDPRTLKKAGFDMAQGSAVAQPLEEAEVDGILS